MKWFKHMTASWDDERLASLVGKGGDSGLALYGAYWRIAEIVAKQMDGAKPSCAVTYPVWRWTQLLFVRKSYLTSILVRLKKEGLLVVEGDPKTDQSVTVKMPNLLKYRDEYSKKSGVAPKSIPPRTEGDTDTEEETDINTLPAGKNTPQEPTTLVLTPESPVETQGKPGKSKKATQPKTEKTEPTKTDLRKKRHAEFKEHTLAYWNYANPGKEMPWGPPEGKQLDMMLSASPNLTLDEYRKMLHWRSLSEVVQSERPSVWLHKVSTYANGPVDRFGKPLRKEHSNANNGTRSKQDRTVDAIEQAAKAVAARHGVGGDGPAAGSGAEPKDAGALRGKVIKFA